MLSRPGFGRLGCGGSPGTAGVAQDAAPAQFALTASKSPPAWRSAQHRSREGEQDGGGRAHSARGRGNRAGGTSRGQHQPAKQVLSSSQPGVPRQSTGKPPFQIPTLPAPPPPVLDKGGTVSHQHRDHQLVVGTALRSLQKQSAYLVQPPKRGIFPRGTREQPFGSGGTEGSPSSSSPTPLADGGEADGPLYRTGRNPGTIWPLFPSLSFPCDTWKGTMPLVEAWGQGPASPGRPLPWPAQQLLPFAPARLPRSQR